MGLIFNGNNGTDTISATDGSLVIDGLDLGGVGNINAGIGTFSGNLNVGGVLTYEDVKNVDSVGIITARDGITVTGGKVGIGTDNSGSGVELHIWDSSPAIRLQDTDPYVENQYGQISQSAGVLQLRGKGDGSTHGSVYLYSQNDSELLSVYRGTDNYQSWYTASDSNSEKMRLSNSGRLGLGTANPTALLHLQGTGGDTSGLYFKNGPHDAVRQYFSTANDNSDFVITYEGTGAAELTLHATGVLGLNEENGDDVLIGHTSIVNNARLTIGKSAAGFTTAIALHNPGGEGSKIISSRSLVLGADYDNNTGADGSIIGFETNGTEKLRIDSSGHVLIGTDTSRQTRLGTNVFGPDIQLENDTIGAASLTRWNNGTSPGRLILQKGRGTGASPAVVADDDHTGQILFSGWDGDTFTNTAQIRSEVEGTPGDDDMPGRLIFATTPDGSPSSIERLRINSTGQLELRKNQGGVTGRPENRIVFRDLDSSVAANQPIGEISWYSTDAGMVNVNSYIRGINEATNGSGALLFGVKAAGSSEIEAMRIGSNGRVGIGTDLSGTDGMLQVFGTGVLARFGNSISSTYECITIRNNTAGYPAISNDSSADTLDLKSLGSVQATIDSNNNSTGKYFRVMTNGTGGAGTELFRVGDDGKVQIDEPNTGPKLSNDNQALEIDTGNGILTIGPQNTSFAHFYTDRGKFYFNNKIVLDEGIVSAYNDDMRLTTGASPDTNTTGICLSKTTNYVGIGTNVPSTVLHLADSNSPAQGADWAAISIGDPNQPLRRVEIGARRSTRGGDWDHVGIGFKVHESNNHTDAPETKMVLDYDGNLGVGTSDPIGKLHISSGTANSDCVVIIQSDTDNNDENSNPQIWFKQDGDISAGLIGMSSNNLSFCNNIASSGGIIFKTGTTNNTGTTDPFTGSTEKFRIAADGKVGIGTNNATRGPLHINQQSTDDVQIHLTNNETGTTSSDGFTIFGGAGTNGRDMGFCNREEGGAIEFLTNMGGTVAQRMALWTDNDITTLAINHAGDGTHSNFIVSNHDTTNYHGTADRSEYPVLYDIHFSGDASGGMTGNRSKGAWRNDVEYTCTNAHSNTSGERMQIYGIHSTVDATKYAYALNGAYFFACNKADDLPRTGTVVGTYGYAQGYINTASSTTKACNIYGGHFLGYRGGDTQGGHCYGVLGRAHQVTSGEATKTGDLTGLLGEVEVDEGTVSTGYAVRAVVDVDDNTGAGHGASTLTNAYLYKGDYSVASNTTCTNRRGIWLNGCTANYMAGNLTITGTFEKGTDNFRIPHPLVGLSTTKDLVHSVIEGPQMDLIYRGKVDLVGGTATINIDTKAGMTEGTFVTLCRDIQCFTSNETGWTAVKGSVTGNKITIIAQDNSCTDTISWMVVGERQDDNAKSATCTDNDGNLIVEPDKKPVVEFEKPECEDNMYNVDPNHNPADDGKD